MKEYYDILGVKYSASEEEIKLVYRKLSKIYHPDMKLTGNEKVFKKISKAYKIIERNNFVYTAVDKQQKKMLNASEYSNEKEYYRDLVKWWIRDFFTSIWGLFKKIFSLMSKGGSYLRKVFFVFFKKVLKFSKFCLKKGFLKYFLFFVGFVILLWLLFLLVNKYTEEKNIKLKQEQKIACITKHGQNSVIQVEGWEEKFPDGCFCKQNFYAEKGKCLEYKNTEKGIEEERLKKEKEEKEAKQILLQREIIKSLFDTVADEDFEKAKTFFSDEYKESGEYETDYSAYGGILSYEISNIECLLNSCVAKVTIEEVGENGKNIFNKYQFEYSFVFENDILKIGSSKVKFAFE